MTKSSICIVSQQAYGAMRGGRSGFIGGIEWQTSLTAKWFAQRGYTVSILTWNEGGPAEEMIDSVRVVKLCQRKEGFPVIRFFHPRWSSLTAAMARVDADIYYQNGSECTTGQVAMWCKRRGKPFIFATASDADCNPALPELHKQERVFYRYGLKHADEVIVQTFTQQKMLREHFGRESVVVPMPCPERPAGAERIPATPPRVLWLGRLCRPKRPDRLLDLAELCRGIQFDLVGPFGAEIDEPAFRKRASELGNVTIHGGVPRERTHDFYRTATLLCSTSDYEGFPNTFLEAWSHGLPVVSTFDPDGVIERERLGKAVANIAEMQKVLTDLLASPDRLAPFAKNARRYFSENHEVEVVLPRFEQIFLNATRRG